MILLCGCFHSALSLSDFSDISQVIIAVANLFLAGYLLFYQKSKDKSDARDTALLNEQNIKLQWFKELIVQPNIEVINSFYTNLHTVKEKIKSNDLSIGEKVEINNFVKAESAKVRKSFIDVLVFVDKGLSQKLLKNLDNLTDSITEAIFNDELKLKREDVYEKSIGSKISQSKSELISSLYNYKGIPS